MKIGGAIYKTPSIICQFWLMAAPYGTNFFEKDTKH